MYVSSLLRFIFIAQTVQHSRLLVDIRQVLPTNNPMKQEKVILTHSCCGDHCAKLNVVQVSILVRATRGVVTTATVRYNSDPKYKQTPFDIGLRVQRGVIFSVSEVSWYKSSMLSTLVRVVSVQPEYMVSILVCARVIRAGHAFLVLVRLCGQRADDALPSLVARLLLLLCRPEGTFLCTCGVGTAVCGQRADALPSLVARSHALVYLWCWYGSMVYILAPALSPGRHALVHLLVGDCWHSSMTVSILVQSSHG